MKPIEHLFLKSTKKFLKHASGVLQSIGRENQLGSADKMTDEIKQSRRRFWERLINDVSVQSQYLRELFDRRIRPEDHDRLHQTLILFRQLPRRLSDQDYGFYPLCTELNECVEVLFEQTVQLDQLYGTGHWRKLSL